MKYIFVNLKRFDVPKSMGGICQFENPAEWVENVMKESVKNGLGRLDDILVTYLMPEALILKAFDELNSYKEDEASTVKIGSQGVFRENVRKGGNFGAFTTNLPAAAAKNMGCSWSIIGHSEERSDKLGILGKFDPAILKELSGLKKAKACIDRMINEEVLCALESGIDVLMCVGETSEEKGEGDFETQKSRIEEVLSSQLEIGLRGVKDYLPERKIVIGYEPIWAIGPGKTPPGKEYISFVSALIKDIVKNKLGFDVPVVYGGGLKEENAGMIAGIETINGGLVALTKFTGDIAFEPEGLRNIIEKYK